MVLGTGPECGEPLVTHPDVALVSFTGSEITELLDYNMDRIIALVKNVQTIGRLRFCVQTEG